MKSFHSFRQSILEDKKDTLTLDIPLFIKLLEMAREDLKSDEAIHELVEKLLDKKDKILSMADYKSIKETETTPKYSEEDQVNEVSKGVLKNYINKDISQREQDLTGQSFKSGKTDEYNKTEETPRTERRLKGINKALDKISESSDSHAFKVNDTVYSGSRVGKVKRIDGNKLVVHHPDNINHLDVFDISKTTKEKPKPVKRIAKWIVGESETLEEN